MREPLTGEDAWLAAALSGLEMPEAVLLGPGHDVAALRTAGGGAAVVTTDVLVDGVHFRLASCGAAQAARKALVANLSDLAAAAAEPLGFVVGAVLPAPPDRTLFDGLMRGFRRAAEELACPLVGGDTNAAVGPLVLAVTAIGRPGPAGVLSRRGARPDDQLSVTGPLGGSPRGRHLTAVPRVREALALARAGVPHAMIDLSDGLARDLPRLCRASGVGARVEARRVPVHPDAAGDPDPLARALGDGEDFELLLAHAPLDEATRAALAAAGVDLVRIGVACGEAEGLALLGPGGEERPWPAGGWDHVSG